METRTHSDIQIFEKAELSAHHQSLRCQVRIDRFENLRRQSLRFQQMAELEQRRRVRCALAIEVDTDKSANRLAVVDGVFNAFIGQTEALLGHVHAQHSGQANWRTTWAGNLRVVRLDQLVQLAPRRGHIDLGEEAVAARQLLLGCVLKVGKALLHDRWQTGNVALLSQVAAPAGTRAAELIRASLVRKVENFDATLAAS